MLRMHMILGFNERCTPLALREMHLKQPYHRLEKLRVSIKRRSGHKATCVHSRFTYDSSYIMHEALITPANSDTIHWHLSVVTM